MFFPRARDRIKSLREIFERSKWLRKLCLGEGARYFLSSPQKDYTLRCFLYVCRPTRSKHYNKKRNHQCNSTNTEINIHHKKTKKRRKTEGERKTVFIFLPVLKKKNPHIRANKLHISLLSIFSWI